ncbi:MAG: orotidine-5'-phosphate decarboxylase [Desulfobacterota bacterium]|nr:orotidine-5'-phosphate decarboxylase [Thermodesulfobacteriota bacterium]MDW8002021.1 orotidine-5'-phosphate decarboxylase [Deltaproteobacteria bacterium]
MLPKERIILALDVERFQEAQKLVLSFKDEVGMFKVGKQLFTHCGPKIIDFIKMKDAKVFLDLKYHDIPNTVAKASVEAVKLGVDMLNLHALGGLKMMEEAKNAVHNAAKELGIKRPKILAVTVLTSVDQGVLEEMGLKIKVSELTQNLSVLAKKAGMDGVVAGGEDIEKVRKLCGEEFIIVTPGIRIDEKIDDQKRVITPTEAILRGATYIVIGRTILTKDDPHAELRKIAKSIENALSYR